MAAVDETILKSIGKSLEVRKSEIRLGSLASSLLTRQGWAKYGRPFESRYGIKR